ncbi:MAG TPA: prepilin-type N-terminal cleavage/methylation domain-containing protein [Terriglobales bacterium]|nr:prepilin-type N-terminal cleavage/methylation domain-containing protein [Terriglobales bacterium]
MIRPQRGFTLMELVIVLAIILVIAAVTIPSLIAMKIRANEASALASIRAIQTAETSYEAAYPTEGYAGSLSVLADSESCRQSSTSACLLDEGLSSGTKAGYNFAVSAGNLVNGANTSYVAGAAPESYNRTGVRRYCSTEKSVIRLDANKEGSTNPPTTDECVRFAAMR